MIDNTIKIEEDSDELEESCDEGARMSHLPSREIFSVTNMTPLKQMTDISEQTDISTSKESSKTKNLMRSKSSNEPVTVLPNFKKV